MTKKIYHAECENRVKTHLCDGSFFINIHTTDLESYLRETTI